MTLLATALPETTPLSFEDFGIHLITLLCRPSSAVALGDFSVCEENLQTLSFSISDFFITNDLVHSLSVPIPTVTSCTLPQ